MDFIVCPATFILSYFSQFVYSFVINFVVTKFTNILWSVYQNELINAPYYTGLDRILESIFRKFEYYLNIFKIAWYCQKIIMFTCFQVKN